MAGSAIALLGLSRWAKPFISVAILTAVMPARVDNTPGQERAECGK
jgi:hypothetical protein